MNKKGFTLVEILAVVALIAILFTVAVPGVMKISTKSKDSMYKNKITMIEDAATLYVDDYGVEDTKLISVKDLLDTNYLKKEKEECNGDCVSNPKDDTGLDNKKVCICKVNNRSVAQVIDGNSLSNCGSTVCGEAMGGGGGTPTNIKYNVTLHTNGGTINSGNITQYTSGVGATLPTNLSKLGYVFDGWFDNEGLNGYKKTNITSSDSGDKEYWAKWTLKTYYVTLKNLVPSGNLENITLKPKDDAYEEHTDTYSNKMGWHHNRASYTTSKYFSSNHSAYLPSPISSNADASDITYVFDKSLVTSKNRKKYKIYVRAKYYPKNTYDCDCVSIDLVSFGVNSSGGHFGLGAGGCGHSIECTNKDEAKWKVTSHIITLNFENPVGTIEEDKSIYAQVYGIASNSFIESDNNGGAGYYVDDLMFIDITDLYDGIDVTNKSYGLGAVYDYLDENLEFFSNTTTFRGCVFDGEKLICPSD